MTTFIFPESGRDVRLASPKGVHKLLSEPLSTLSQWYSSNFRHGKAEEEEKEKPAELALVQSPDDRQSAHPRLHEVAESCLSSLRAGTASIVVTSSRPHGGIHFLEMPVRYCRLCTHALSCAAYIAIPLPVTTLFTGWSSSAHIFVPGCRLSLSPGSDV